MKTNKFINILSKKKLLIIILSLIIISFSSFAYYQTTRSLIINFPGYFDKESIDYINDQIKASDFRNIDSDKYFIDKIFKIFYSNLSFNSYFFQEDFQLKNKIYSYPYYATVEINSNLVRINKELKEKLLNEFKNNLKSEVIFQIQDELNMNRRILLSDKTGKPVIFYKIITFKVINFLNKIDLKTEKKIKIIQKNPEYPILLGFTGDLVIEDFVIMDINKHGFDFTFNEVNSLLRNPDIMSTNLECVISERGKPEVKSFTYASSEKYFKIIALSPIDYTSLANNHAMDYGEISLLDTIEYLDKYGIYHSGSGKNIDAAFTPVVIQKKENKFSYFSICDVPVESRGYDTIKTFSAKKSKPGIAYYDIDIIKKNIIREKEKGNLVIVQFHTGIEYDFSPDKIYRERSKKIINLGADVVICHHPHVINGIELYKNKLIAYSLGDFLFDIQTHKDSDEGILLYLFVNKNKIISWAIYPTISEYGKVSLDEKRIKIVEERFLKLTKELE